MNEIGDLTSTPVDIVISVVVGYLLGCIQVGTSSRVDGHRLIFAMSATATQASGTRGRPWAAGRRFGVPPLCEAGVVVRFHATAEAA
jgi:hypothetical protein